MRGSAEFHKAFSNRFYVLYGIMGVAFLILIVGLGYRQLVLGKNYQKKQELQSLRRIIQPGTRGNIYDRNGKLLAGSLPRYSAVLYLTELREAFKTAYQQRLKAAKLQGKKINRPALNQAARQEVVQGHLDVLSQLLGQEVRLSWAKLEAHFQQRLLLPLTLVTGLQPDQYARLTEQLPIDSPLQVLVDSVRYYPYGATASHVIGYITSHAEAPDPHMPGEELSTLSYQSQQGKTGLEKQFDEHLQGSSGGAVWVVDPAGFQHDLLYHQQRQSGKHLTCSLDIDLQQAAEAALGDMCGSVVVLDVATGEVLVLASKPNYDLNALTTGLSQAQFQSINEQGAWFHRALQGLYPPGSPFKLITAIALLKAGTIDASTQSQCEGFLSVGNRKFRCMARFGHGNIDIVESLSKSCNVFFYQYSLQLGIEALANEARLFGLHEPTGIELPYEAKRMVVPDPQWKALRGLGPWLAGDTLNVSIGQGYLLATPLQMACVAGALAAERARFYPTILHNNAPNNTVIGQPSRKVAEPLGLTDADYNTLVQGMIRVAASGTAAKRIQVPGVTVAAKTGTAQAKQKDKDLDVAWFLGFAPAQSPAIAIVVALEPQEETDAYGGGSTAAPVANKVLQAYFKSAQRK